MRIWRKRPSPEKVAENIAVLERELGLDDATVLAEVEQKKLDRFNSRRGPVLLDRPRWHGPDVAALARMQLITGVNPTADLIEWKPGAKFVIDDPSHVQFFATSAVSVKNHPQVIPAPKSRVVLPAGVRA